ncbi:MAG: glutathione S-transferase N-terminal domain-containing protein [Pseudomonadota bacterium]
MIDLYTWGTPNGRKVSIMLEEVGLDYTVKPIDITGDDQFSDEFLAISPNNKIPAIVDHDNGSFALMESGAILMYLAEKTGRLLPNDGAAKWRTVEWLMLQMGGVGPMLGQVHHFVKFNPDASEYAATRYSSEAARLYGVLDKRLSDHEYLADEYSIADIATWPWISRFEWQQMDLNEYPDLKRWYLSIAQRPAVQAGYHIPGFVQEIPMPEQGINP